MYKDCRYNCTVYVRMNINRILLRLLYFVPEGEKLVITKRTSTNSSPKSRTLDYLLYFCSGIFDNYFSIFKSFVHFSSTKCIHLLSIFI